MIFRHGKDRPLAKMYTVGHDLYLRYPCRRLRYHGVSPIVSQLYEDKLIEAKAYGQSSVFEAAVIFARTEGIVPAPESSHAIRAAIDEALLCKESGEAKVILFNLSGHGYFDMAAYDNYFSGKLSDVDYSEEEIARSMKNCQRLTNKL